VRKLHFISGLPRSGSTLLAAILRQNPEFQASMTSGLGGLLSANLQAMSVGTELPLLIETKKRAKILRAICEVYYQDEGGNVVFDTNRVWCAKLPLIHDLFPDAKVIACVRDVSWVMDSMERVFRKNPYENTRLFVNDEERTTVYSRLESLGRQNRLVGFPWAALKEAFYGEHANKLLVVDYELLARAPEKVLQLIYRFLDEPWFDGHDFDNVEYQAEDFDQALGVSGLHKVAPKVEFIPRQTILPPDLFEKFQGMNFWRDVTGSGAYVITAQNANDTTQPKDNKNKVED
jgi:sulfotransferase